METNKVFGFKIRTLFIHYHHFYYNIICSNLFYSISCKHLLKYGRRGKMCENVVWSESWLYQFDVGAPQWSADWWGERGASDVSTESSERILSLKADPWEDPVW